MEKIVVLCPSICMSRNFVDGMQKLCAKTFFSFSQVDYHIVSTCRKK